MKRLLMIPIAATIAALVSCAAKPVVEMPSEPTTTVESIYVDGKVFAGYVFKEVTHVTVTTSRAADAPTVTFTAGDIAFDQRTTELTFKDGSWGDAQRFPDAWFTIVGTIAKPAQYVLYGATSAAPLVAKAGVLLANGSDYRYDAETRLLTFIEPLDVEEDSYSIYWKQSAIDIVGIVNKKEAHEAAYDELYGAWEAANAAEGASDAAAMNAAPTSDDDTTVQAQ